jgi:hypothetical protein
VICDMRYVICDMRYVMCNVRCEMCDGAWCEMGDSVRGLRLEVGCGKRWQRSPDGFT